MSAKFKVGDRVRTVHYENGFNAWVEDGHEFVVTGIGQGRFGYYYLGNNRGIGVWESRLELVPNSTPESKPEVTESTRTDLYYQTFPGAEWVSIYADQADRLRAKGYPVRKVTTETTTTVEYLP